MLDFGLDGCRSGWVVAWIGSNGRRGFEIVSEIGSLGGARMAMIDIPIGLPESGYRAVDRAARTMLGKACSRVFLGARRPLLTFLDDYPRANAWAKTDGKGISRQLFGILPKIAQIDRFITQARQDSFRECHPELVFQRLNGGAPLPGKKAPHGARLRRDLIARNGFAEIDTWLGSLRGTGAQPDDLLDACACAFAAFETLHTGGRKVACPQETDARGLRIEMWY
jgi:predicted RNase H-like nuclease